MDLKERELAVRRMALLLADELSVSENSLKRILEEAFKIKDKNQAFKYISDEIWNLTEGSIYSVAELAEDKNREGLPLSFIPAFIALNKATIRNKIEVYATQFLKEIENKSKLISFYKPKIDKKTLNIAREAANLPYTAKSSITNLKVLLSGTMADALNKADIYLMSGKGAAGYIGVRQSTYDCPVCDSLCGYFIPITEQVFPAHARCVCGMIPIYTEEYD